ncbi:MAG: HAD-IIA family hydrolase [Clostridiales bacterium]|nr:HAD-IIA family hydrolase [Clostridiales bacterium]
MNAIDLSNKKLFLMDMDGTIYLDDKLLPGAREFIDRTRAKGRAVFLTNNSSRGIDAYLEKMARLGVPATEDDFLTSVDATIYYLEDHFGKNAGNKIIYVMGTESFKKQLKDAGFKVTGIYSDDIEIVLLGFDRELTYRKLEDVSRLLTEKPEIPYFAANPDWVCPSEFGYVPDCGSMAEMLWHATGRKPIFMGKPEPLMAELAMKKFGCTKEETLIMGDRIYTDIACGVNAGVDTAFLLSGEGVLEDIDKYGIEPTYIFNSIKEIIL